MNYVLTAEQAFIGSKQRGNPEALSNRLAMRILSRVKTEIGLGKFNVEIFLYHPDDRSEKETEAAIGTLQKLGYKVTQNPLMEGIILCVSWDQNSV